MRNNLIELTLNLDGANPQVFRTLMLPLDLDLHELHQIIQGAFLWEDDSAYTYMLEGEMIEDDEIIPEVLNKKGVELLYNYANGWKVNVLTEGFRYTEDLADYPLCIKGAGASPPQKIDSIAIYNIAITNWPKSITQEAEMLRSIVLADFMPDEFDVDLVNQSLGKYFDSEEGSYGDLDELTGFGELNEDN